MYSVDTTAHIVRFEHFLVIRMNSQAGEPTAGVLPLFISHMISFASFPSTALVNTLSHTGPIASTLVAEIMHWSLSAVMSAPSFAMMRAAQEATGCGDGEDIGYMCSENTLRMWQSLGSHTNTIHTFAR
jgi:hypothetical protein